MWRLIAVSASMYGMLLLGCKSHASLVLMNLVNGHVTEIFERIDRKPVTIKNHVLLIMK